MSFTETSPVEITETDIEIDAPAGTDESVEIGHDPQGDLESLDNPIADAVDNAVRRRRRREPEPLTTAVTDDDDEDGADGADTPPADDPDDDGSQGAPVPTSTPPAGPASNVKLGALELTPEQAVATEQLVGWFASLPEDVQRGLSDGTYTVQQVQQVQAQQQAPAPAPTAPVAPVEPPAPATPSILDELTEVNPAMAEFLRNQEAELAELRAWREQEVTARFQAEQQTAEQVASRLTDEYQQVLGLTPELTMRLAQQAANSQLIGVYQREGLTFEQAARQALDIAAWQVPEIKAHLVASATGQPSPIVTQPGLASVTQLPGTLPAPGSLPAPVAPTAPDPTLGDQAVQDATRQRKSAASKSASRSTASGASSRPQPANRRDAITADIAAIMGS